MPREQDKGARKPAGALGFEGSLCRRSFLKTAMLGSASALLSGCRSVAPTSSPG